MRLMLWASSCLYLLAIATTAGESKLTEMQLVDIPKIDSSAWKWTGGALADVPTWDANFDPEKGLLESDGHWGTPKSIAIDKDGSIAIASDRGLFIWRDGKMRAYTAKNEDANRNPIPGNSTLPHPWVSAVVFSDSGDVWAATAQGIYVVKKDEYRILKCGESFDYAQNFESLFKRSNGTIVAGGRQCVLLSIDPKAETVEQLYSNPGKNWVTSISETPDGALWFSIISEGVFRHDGKTLSKLPLQQSWIPTPYVYSALLDSEQTLWVACQEGLGFHRADNTSALVAATEMPDIGVWQLGLCKSGVIIRTFKGLVLHRTAANTDEKSGPWRYGPVEPCGAFAFSPDGTLFSASSLRIVKLNPETFDERNPATARVADARKAVETAYPKLPELPYLVSVDAKGGVWLAIDKEIWRYDGKAWTERSELLNGREASLLFQDSKKRTWMGTSGNGLIDISATPPRALNQQEHMMLAYIRDIKEQDDGVLWVGTGYGLYRLNGEKWDQVIGGTDIHSIAIDKVGRVWCFSSDSGLYVVANSVIRTLRDVPELKGMGSETVLMRDAMGTVKMVWNRAAIKGSEQVSIALDDAIFKQSITEPDVEALAQLAKLPLHISIENGATRFAFADQPKVAWDGLSRVLSKLSEKLLKKGDREIRRPVKLYIPGSLTMLDFDSVCHAVQSNGFTNLSYGYEDGSPLWGDVTPPPAPAKAPDTTVAIHVAAPGKENVYQMNDKKLSKVELEKELVAATEKNVKILISFDSATQFGDVLVLLPLCAKAGYAVISLQPPKR